MTELIAPVNVRFTDKLSFPWIVHDLYAKSGPFVVFNAHPAPVQDAGAYEICVELTDVSRVTFRKLILCLQYRC